MLRGAVTRFQSIALLAAFLALVALLLGKWLWFGIIIVAWLMIIGLGVAIPELRLFGNFICQGDASKRQVALTFDDGPDENSTPALLELLRQHDVEAAFFAIGRRVDAHPKLANQILRGGHLLENHTYHHSNATNFYSVARLERELAQTQAAILKHTGTTPHFFRPPVGLSNPNTFKAAAAQKLRVIGWNIRSLDRRITDPEKIVQRIENRLRPGAIILLHDADIPADRLVVTVKLLLAKLREHGYEVVRLDRMLT